MVNFVAIILDKQNNVKIEKLDIPKGDDSFKVGKCTYLIDNKNIRFVDVKSMLFFKKRVSCLIYNENSPKPLNNEFKVNAISGKDITNIVESNAIAGMFKPEGAKINGKVLGVLAVGLIVIVIFLKESGLLGGA